METTTITAGSLRSARIESAAKRRFLGTKQFFIALTLLSVLLVSSCILTFHAYIAWSLARPAVAPLTSNPWKAVGLPYEEVQFLSLNDKTKLEGWYIPAPVKTDKTVIFSHGYGGNREEIWVPIYDLAKAVHNKSYNVLMFDYGFVKPGQVATGGVQEANELMGAMEFVKQTGTKAIFIWGFSMGAGTALQAALYRNDISAMILDSTFITDPDTIYHNLKQHVDLPRYPSLPLVRWFFPLLNGTSLKEVPYKEVKSTAYQAPIYFIHGKGDKKAPYQIVQNIFQNQRDNSKFHLWLLPHERHELIYRAHKEEYLERTLSFLTSVD